MRFSTATVAAVAALLPSLTAAVKTSRTFAVMHFYGNGNGDGSLVTARMDPVVSPGQISAHLHTVMGGNKFSMTMNGDAATEATCTNALIANDKSNYWTPSLFFHNGNGTFVPVPMFYMNVYYFFEATDDEIVPFPDGFRMISGNPDARSPPATGANVLDPNDGVIQPVQFTCPRSSTSTPLYPANGPGIPDPTGPLGRGAGFPDQNCDGYASPLRADIHFPSCYNPAAGPEAYATNTQFPTSKGATNGANCPEGWLHIPHIFFEVYWNTPLFANEWTPGQGKQPFVLSNGDPTGYSLHGDFVNGWDSETLKAIIGNCDAGDSGMDKCPTIIGGLSDTSKDCYIESPIEETVTGTMYALPGCNPIQAGPAAAVKMTCLNGAASVVSSLLPAKTSAAAKPTYSTPAIISHKSTPTTLQTYVKPTPSSAKKPTYSTGTKKVTRPKPTSTKKASPPKPTYVTTTKKATQPKTTSTYTKKASKPKPPKITPSLYEAPMPKIAPSLYEAPAPPKASVHIITVTEAITATIHSVKYAEPTAKAEEKHHHKHAEKHRKHKSATYRRARR